MRRPFLPFDYVVEETKFAGPTCFQRGDNDYYNAQGDKISTQRSPSLRKLLAPGSGFSRNPLN